MNRILFISSILLELGLVMTGAYHPQLLLGDVKGEKYLKVSPSRVESVGIESVFFYDITRDGVPEIWMITDDCEALRMILVYSLSDWGKELFRDSASNSIFYAGEGYVLQQSAHMGHAYWHQLRWNGKKVVAKKVFEEYTDGDYKTPQEKPLKGILPEDLYPTHILKQESEPLFLSLLPVHYSVTGRTEFPKNRWEKYLRA